MDAKELKPCPFCGSKNITVGYLGQPAQTIFATCQVCGADGPAHQYHGGVGSPVVDLGESWNRRAASDAAQAPEAWTVEWPSGPQETWHSVYINERDALEWASKHENAKVTPLYAAPVPPAAPIFDMLAHLTRQREWSERTFGPGSRAKGVVDHIRKELREIEANPTDLTEWIDVVILALDGAWRAGGSPQQIIDTIVAKQTKNEGRTWPDWRTMSPDQAIEHDRSADVAPAAVAPSHPTEKTGADATTQLSTEIVDKPVQSGAARDVLAERARQVTAERWMPERDDSYRNNELPRAAAAYILGVVSKTFDRGLWPWNKKWWKPTTPRRDLVKAGALILAEIERIDRAGDGA